MGFKLKAIRTTKSLFYVLRLHVIFGPLSNALLQLAYLSKLSKWIHQNKAKTKNDFWLPRFDYMRRYQLYEYLMANHGMGEEIDYMEFGVSEGHSLKWWVEHNKAPGSRFWGFDTFEGLPEDWGVFKKGDMSIRSEFPPIHDTRLKFVKGLFQDTLPQVLKEYTPGRRRLIHMDADLFSATLYTLATIHPYLKKGDIIMFDEFAVPTHEFLAFSIYQQSFYANWKPLIGLNNFFFAAFEVQ